MAYIKKFISFNISYEKASISSRGFTLLEILIVVVILGIMASVVTLSFSVSERSQADAVVRKVIALMNEGSYMAITTGKEYGVFWRLGSKSFILKSREEQGWVQVLAIQEVTVPKGIDVDRIDQDEDLGTLTDEYQNNGRERVESDFLIEGFKEVYFDETGFKKVDFRDVAAREKTSLIDEEDRLLVLLENTGLWTPEGQVEFSTAERKFSLLVWGATGKAHLQRPPKKEQLSE